MNVREYGIKSGQSRETGNIEYTWRRQTKQKHNVLDTTIMQINTNKTNKTSAFLQTTGAKHEPNHISMSKRHYTTYVISWCYASYQEEVEILFGVR